MPQAKIAKRAEFLNNFVMRISNHEAKGHIFQPNELEVARVIIDVQIA